MPLKHYGVWQGRPIDCRLGTGSSPHYQILMVDDLLRFRIAVNVKSQAFPSEVKYIVIEDFGHTMPDRLKDLAAFVSASWSVSVLMEAQPTVSTVGKTRKKGYTTVLTVSSGRSRESKG